MNITTQSHEDGYLYYECALCALMKNNIAYIYFFCLLLLLFFSRTLSDHGIKQL